MIESAHEGEIILGDCLEQMRRLPDQSVDMVLADLPYGMTQNPWDSVIDLPALWAQLSRICTGAMVFTACQPFSSSLVSSNLRDFRYSLVWLKTMPTGHLDAKRKPLRKHEDILVFWGKRPPYHPQITFGHAPYSTTRKPGSRASTNWGKMNEVESKSESTGSRYPTSILEYKHERGYHPTQKPVALLENLIKTYTHPGACILDPTMGSGSTGIAALQCGRRFIGIERDPKYFQVARDRILGAAHQSTLELATA